MRPRRAAITAAFSATILSFAIAQPAHAGQRAPTGLSVRPSVGAAPYAPATVFDQPGADGAQRCFNHYHEYGATPGCGGVDLSFTLPDAATYDPYSHAGATATVTRTYGCAGAHRTRTVLRKTTDVTFQNVYIPDLGYWTAADGSARLELFYAAPAEDVTCRPGEEARHLSTRVSRLVLKIISSQQTIRSWRRAGSWTAKTPERS